MVILNVEWYVWDIWCLCKEIWHMDVNIVMASTSLIWLALCHEFFITCGFIEGTLSRHIRWWFYHVLELFKCETLKGLMFACCVAYGLSKLEMINLISKVLLGAHGFVHTTVCFNLVGHTSEQLCMVMTILSLEMYGIWVI